MSKMRRRPADREQFWRETITSWKKSGQSIRAFCAARGIAGRRDEARQAFSLLPSSLHADFATTFAEQYLHDWVWRTVNPETPPPSWAITDATTGRALMFRDEPRRP